jgi:glycerol-3-phosphate dehydrogenase (NAD(P)+)
MSNRPLKVGIIGSGSWGTALSIVANRAGSKAVLWTRNEYVMRSISDTRKNDTYLPDVFIDPRIEVTDKLGDACQSDIVMLVVPSQHVRATCIMIADQLDASVPVVIATKGIERGSLALMSEVVSSILPKNPVAVLTGPNFASEIAKGLPAAATIACQGDALANQIIYAIGGKFFRTYHTDDIIGAQIGGAVKNVIAIACGVAVGRGFGQNARAAIITRGLMEMTRLCVAKGGRPETLMGLSGMGDLVLTCTSTASRNTSLGIDLCDPDRSTRAILDAWQKRLAEGITSADSVTELAKKLGILMPICKAVHDIITEQVGIDDAIQSLMERQFVPEVKHTSF